MLNTEQAIQNLIANLGKFPQLPFLTDREVRGLFGEEVGYALQSIDEINKERRICSTCGGKCCQQMECELFDETFERCPISEHRPLLCRFHYCEKFGEDLEPMGKQLLDVFVKGVSRLESEHSSIPSVELNMLLYRTCRLPEKRYPGLVEDLQWIVAAAKQGKLAPEEELAMLRDRVESYRRSRMSGVQAPVKGETPS